MIEFTDLLGFAAALAAALYGLFQRKARRSLERALVQQRDALEKAAAGYQALGSHVRAATSALVEAMLPEIRLLVESAEKLPIPNNKKNLLVYATYCQKHPASSKRAVNAAIDRALSELKAG